jgi:hypothetical protein
MAEFRQFVYTNTGTEIDFMEGLVDLICGLDSSITVVDVNGNPTTVAEQYEERSSTNTPQFIFEFGTGFNLGIKRNNSTNNVVDKIQVGVGSGTNISYNGSFWGDTLAIDTDGNRSQFVAYLKSDTMVGIWIGPYTGSFTYNIRASILKLITPTANYVGGIYNSNAVMTSNFIGNNSNNNFYTLLSYNAEAGNIDYINHSIFMSGGVKSFTFPDIYSCSTVSIGTSIALPNGKNYFAIGTNALVEVEPEIEEAEQKATTEDLWDSVPSKQ